MLRTGKNAPPDVGNTGKVRRTHRGSGGSGKELLSHTDGLLTLGRTLGAGGLHRTIGSLNINHVRRNTMK
jgi:hypothetical protein